MPVVYWKQLRSTEPVGVEMRLTEKQEKFAQLIVEGKANQTKAYRACYSVKRMKDKGVHEEACKLRKNPKVAHRIEELRREVVRRLEYSIEDAMRECDEAIEIAKEARQASAIVSAVTLKSKLMGILVEKKKVDTTVSHGSEPGSETERWLCGLLGDKDDGPGVH